MASVAELEAGLISERTKAALAAAKARGLKLGNPNGARALRGKQVGNKQAVAAVKANAEHRAATLRAIVDDLRTQGITSVRAVVFAKLDRLTRNVDLLRSLVASDVDLVFCDLPHVPPGAMGRFLLTQMASVAELEAGLISERTKAALAAAKARRVKLGNPNGARALRGKQVGNKQAVAAVKAKAAYGAANLRAIVDDLKAQGITSVRAVAAALNERGILTPREGAWHPTSAARLLSRLQA
jgi:DNA invertase Pin-like site-specific DNA recombinase